MKKTKKNLTALLIASALVLPTIGHAFADTQKPDNTPIVAKHSATTHKEKHKNKVHKKKHKNKSAHKAKHKNKVKHKNKAIKA